MTLGSTIQTVAAITTAIFSIGIYEQIKRLTPPSQNPDFVDKVRQAAIASANAAASAAADQAKK